jgi:hypothetical protein
VTIFRVHEWVQNPGNLAEVQQVLSRYSKSEHPMLVEFISNLSMAVHDTVKIGIMKK